jgi:hypothetical protein
VPRGGSAVGAVGIEGEASVLLYQRAAAEHQTDGVPELAGLGAFEEPRVAADAAKEGGGAALARVAGELLGGTVGEVAVAVRRARAATTADQLGDFVMGRVLWVGAAVGKKQTSHRGGWLRIIGNTN